MDNSDPKTKNIRQTELLIDLRNAITQICKHFSHCNEKHNEKIILNQVFSFYINYIFGLLFELTYIQR